VSQALLGTQGNDGLGIRIQADFVAALVPVADCLAQARDALGLGVPVGVTAPGGLCHLVDDMFRRRLVGVAHTEIDDVLSRRPGLLFQITDDVENIGGKALYSPKLIVHVKPALLGATAGGARI
jgi:hypothetical protein